MKITVTFRHVRSTVALRRYAEEKIARLDRYLHRPMEAHVVLEVLKKSHRAEIHLIANGTSIFGDEETTDLYSAIDLALDKVERQLKKLAARKKERKAAARPETRGVRLHVLAADASEPGQRAVIRSRRVPAKPLSVEEAVLQMDRSRDEFFVFRDASTESLCVLYRRRDGNYGLIEPEPA